MSRPVTFGEESRKVAAFFRRDLRVMLSYRLAVVGDWFSLLLQTALFAFVSRMVDQSTLPTFQGVRPTYLQFVTIGIAVNAFMHLGLRQVVAAIRNEQLTGTLEALLLTPTALTTVQLGSAVYELVYIPLRTVAFLALVAALFGVQYAFGSLGPALAVIAAFVPVVWGLGVASAAGTLTFRRGSGAAGMLAAVLSAASGSYFPVDLLPGWLQPLMRYNPITVTLDGTRQALLGGAGWGEVAPALLLLLPMAAASVMLGAVAFRLAVRRELRRGTLHLY